MFFYSTFSQLHLKREVATLRNHSREQDRRLEALTRELEIARRHSAPGEHRIFGVPSSGMSSTAQHSQTSDVISESVSNAGLKDCLMNGSGAAALPLPASARPAPGCIGAAAVRGPPERNTRRASAEDPFEIKHITHWQKTLLLDLIFALLGMPLYPQCRLCRMILTVRSEKKRGR